MSGKKNIVLIVQIFVININEYVFAGIHKYTLWHWPHANEETDLESRVLIVYCGLFYVMYLVYINIYIYIHNMTYYSRIALWLSLDIVFHQPELFGNLGVGLPYMKTT